MPANTFKKHNTSNAKVNETIVRDIRRRFAAGETHNALCKRYDISGVQVGRITRRESWAWVTDTEEELVEQIPSVHGGVMHRLANLSTLVQSEGSGTSPLDEGEGE